MIQAARFRNFKALRDVELNLERLTVLVGPNASGKTSVLKGLSYLSQLCTTKPQRVFTAPLHDPTILRARSAAGPMELSLRGSWGGVTGGLSVQATEEKDEYGREDWTYAVKASLGEVENAYATHAPWDLAPPYEQLDYELWNGLGDLDRHLRAVFLRFDPARLSRPSYSEDLNPHLSASGDGLASVLAEIVLRPGDFQSLQEALRAVVPAVERVSLARAAVHRTETETVTIDNAKLARKVKRRYMGHQVLVDMAGAQRIPAHAVSEGTLLVLGLLTVLHQAERPRLLLIDDLERGLHPKALLPLVQQIRRLLELDPLLQIVATTHSPYLLDCLKFGEVRLTTATADGSVLCAGLCEHPAYPEWRDSMLPGEFWSMVAEDWIRQQKEEPA